MAKSRHFTGKEKTFKILSSAAEEGDIEAWYQLGLMYQSGEGVAQNLQVAVTCMKHAANHAHIKAQHWLGEIFFHGKGIEKDAKQAFEWFQKAAVQGLSAAQKNIGFMYFHGVGVKKNDTEAFKWVKAAAVAPDPDVIFILGYLYAHGLGTEKDEKEAVKAYHTAADLGSLGAQFNLGIRYKEGQGVIQNIETALAYYTKAADKNHLDAQYNLGLLYYERDAPGDAKLAITYFKLAADQGKKEAQLNAALLLQQKYTFEDDQLAVKYMKLAAAQGVREAQHNLGVRYSVGRGVEQDSKQSDYYFKLATTIDIDDAFYKFTSTRSIKGLTASPAMFLVVLAKDAKENVTEQGLYQHIFSSDVVAHKSYIPANPPLAKNQRGPTCGLKSLEIGLAWGYKNRKTPLARKNPIKRLTMDKDRIKKSLQVEGDSSLREYVKHIKETKNGEIYDVNTLKKAAAYFGFNQCETIKSDEEHYIDEITKAIRTKHSVILAVDNGEDDFPGQYKGKRTHYALAWGYLYKNADYHFLVTHHGKHFLWSAKALLQSHLQLPKINPCVGEYYKDRGKDNYVSKDQITKENTFIIEEKNLRIVPEGTLENFIWHALTIPTLEENFLQIDEKLVTDETSVATAIKSSDAVMLKLLVEQGASITPPKTGKTFEEIAKENHDPFSLTLLQHATKKSSLDETPLSKRIYR